MLKKLAKVLFGEIVITEIHVPRAENEEEYQEQMRITKELLMETLSEDFDICTIRVRETA